jgi:hypothetical protein
VTGGFLGLRRARIEIYLSHLAISKISKHFCVAGDLQLVNNVLKRRRIAMIVITKRSITPAVRAGGDEILGCWALVPDCEPGSGGSR